MFIAALIVSSAIATAPRAQTPPRPMPEPTPPASIQEPAGRTAEKADAGQAAAVPAGDAAFVRKAAAAGRAEVAMARLGQDKAEHADVKAFAAKLEKDHSAANAELKDLAGQKKIMLAEAAGHGPDHARLAKLSGASFDRAFVTAMVEAHQKDVEAFEKASSGAADRDVKAFAGKMLPTLKEHLRTVQELSKTVGARKPAS